MHPSIPTSHTTNIFNKNISKKFFTWLRGAGHAPVRDEVGDPLDVPDGETVAGPGVVAEGEAGEGGQGCEGPHRVVPQQVVVQAQHLQHHICYHQKNIFTKLNNCWPGTVKVSNRLLLRWEMRESEGLGRKYLGYCICQIFTQCYISLSTSCLMFSPLNFHSNSIPGQAELVLILAAVFIDNPSILQWRVEISDKIDLPCIHPLPGPCQEISSLS